MPFVHVFSTSEWMAGVKLFGEISTLVYQHPVVVFLFSVCTCLPFFKLHQPVCVEALSLSFQLSFSGKKGSVSGLLTPISPLGSLMHEELHFSTGYWFIGFIFILGAVRKEINCTTSPMCIRDDLYIYSNEFCICAGPSFCVPIYIVSLFWKRTGFPSTKTVGEGLHGYSQRLPIGAFIDRPWREYV